MDFVDRHIDSDINSIDEMLEVVGVSSMDELINSAFPPSILEGDQEIELPQSISEEEALREITHIAKKNTVLKSLIGQGYYTSIMPSPIVRNVFENPGWYTAYTAYQAEISQGRLEALFNFQTLSTELTGHGLASASLLDEGTAIAEAIACTHRQHKAARDKILMIEGGHPQNNSVVHTRMKALGIGIEISTIKNIHLYDFSEFASVVIQMPTTRGLIYDIQELVSKAHDKNCYVIASIDPLFLCVAGSPAKWGIDIVVGSFQRFGIPLGYGGPSAAYFTASTEFKRQIPGRIVGESKDTKGRKAYRFALQTREQHIRREKATSNICTSQVLLAVLSSFYAIYHGYKGLKNIALRIFSYAHRFREQLRRTGFTLITDTPLFDTVCWNAGDKTVLLFDNFYNAGYNIRRIGDQTLSVSFDEATTEDDFEAISLILELKQEKVMKLHDIESIWEHQIYDYMNRTEAILTQEVFDQYHTETELMRYCRRLMDRDLALDRSMIPLGSCTMKLNSASEMIPLSWQEFANIHPFAPLDQSTGFQEIISDLSAYLCELTGFDKISLQPNSGSQGEFAGLLAIRSYQASIGEMHRNICLIPSSAHGTNPASASMVGLDVVIVSCDSNGNIDFEDLKEKVKQYAQNLSVLMITYPSTHGVYEDKVKEICDLIHSHGGQVYIDGANLNALVGISKLALLGADVSHLNLHKTFAIPHGGGGPGVGPIGVKSHLSPFVPENILKADKDFMYAREFANGQVSSSPWGSSLIFIISWMYIRMLGSEGIKKSTIKAVLNANYIANRLSNHYSILYTGNEGRVAHECIIDLREFKELGIEAEDIAKRLIDYEFHAPTMSWPVAGTIMIEPTESESMFELDRFCNAMIHIRKEIDRIEKGVWTRDDNPLVHAPHCAQDLIEEPWDHAYTRIEAAYPFLDLKNSEAISYNKYWPPVSRIDNAHGDKNLICSCPPLETYTK